MKAIAPVTTPVLVELTDGQPTTTSLDVAAHFRKQHKTVLRAIANLECSPEFNQHNFAPIEYTDAAGRKYTQYRMTRDGFTFLCMGFTGKEAAKWKEAYINAFNQMEHTLKHGAPAKSKRPPKLLPNGLSADQQEAIKALVKARVDELPEGKRAKAAITCWSSLKSKFGCTYKEISPEQFTDAVSLIARVVLEGELLGKEEPKAGTVLTDLQLYDVYFVCHHFDCLYEIFKRHNLYTHLTALGSRAAVEMIDHFKDGAMGTWKLNKDLGAEFDAVQRRLKLNQYATWRKD
ncbi:Rha family transcriptional regulator [Pseudomonas aeruginosa]|uniref:Rha family transcriptional regulator n=2 Tax=Pseudomonas aeruginosa TaxID=287 RepID=UPI00163D0C57|nr:Rha family transcriptional regulator [Pseudomonas aeruginosa]MBV5801182.1 Rha family transcriptional regulator [Pseudomonas aeruginosa]MCR6882683.1 Rha family transcriptional regulator [Pseudomonas aeruginosa]MCR6889041.1 Rha family transcriptional regulator [Pseudomonas aeruginosa]MCR6895416.1 Rha family transcriptional regulator [Pseudomonas aeruginosa]MCR6901857.1 Rha family transcriptional regulator [Pseudomonas aeruginosa]